MACDLLLIWQGLLIAMASILQGRSNFSVNPSLFAY